MAKSNMTASRIKPAVSELLTLRVLRSERISANFMRVTLGEGRSAVSPRWATSSGSGCSSRSPATP
ncbi:hypothetical protein Psi01_85420 [Planobispora siamensis]|uniref:Uncharacterized protein n=1 Tax=Planobispora siamensis TaxID=936338 RepID=A0A8J3SPG9_9ACTN|nr:hypothetical protein Psi01_85420 [Planobispora siamensis]